jgi:TatD DNase family protein
MEAEYFDTHCHLDLFGDYASLKRRIEAARVLTIAVTNSPTVYEQNVAMAAGSSFIVVAAGLHPELVVERERELPALLDLIDRSRFVGEVGLDYQTSDKEVRARQRRVFDAILERCDRHGDRILTIHSRRAADDVVASIGTEFRGSPILHWFSGSAAVLERGVRRGCFFSVNAPMLANVRGLELIARIPKQRVLTETDGPFVRSGASPAEPGNIPSVVLALARAWRVDEGEARETIRSNWNALIASGLSR